MLVLILGFITSLLPAWNYNPEDAAAFAVAAREDQEAPQIAGGRDNAGDDGGAPMGVAEAEAAAA